MSLAVKNETVLWVRYLCVWSTLVGCFLLPYFLVTQKEHVFVVLEAGDELPVWQPSSNVFCTHCRKGRCWPALSQPFRNFGKWWCGHCQSGTINKSALIRDKLRLRKLKFTHGKIICLDKSGFFNFLLKYNMHMGKCIHHKCTDWWVCM